MKIIKKPMGIYKTNCYIVYLKDGEIIIDPGFDATSWVLSNVKNPKAILNTHGHFDHVWSNFELKKILNVPIYINEYDAFMLKEDPFGYGMQSSSADILISKDDIFMINDEQIKYWFFPGHTPGCSCIQIRDNFFSGDFVFKNSIGRVDFPYSSPSEMKKSILKILNFKENFKIYPGHGDETTLDDERLNLKNYLNYFEF